MTSCPVDGRTLPKPLWFPPGLNASTRLRTERPRQIVLHWTGALNPVSSVHRTLTNRKLSVNYVTHPDGAAFRLADDLTRTGHASAMNDGAIGIENVGLGFVPKVARWRTHKNWPGVEFESYDMQLAGKTKRVVAFPPAQVTTIVAMCEQLCAMHAIPRLIPDFGRVKVSQVRRFARAFAGVLGHYHCHMKTSRWSKGYGTKWDPGSQIFDELEFAGFRRVGMEEVMDTRAT